jgi:hypothetical protein
MIEHGKRERYPFADEKRKASGHKAQIHAKLCCTSR